MGAYSLEHIIREWGRGNLTAEQVIGQILLLLQDLRQQLARIEARLARMEQPPRR